MAGFGRGAFGRSEVGPVGGASFGEWRWSRQILFDYLPQIYQDADKENGNALATYVEGVRGIFDGLRDKIRNIAQLRDAMTIRTKYNERRPLIIGRVIPQRSPVLHQAGDGLIQNGSSFFESPSARFTYRDIGRELRLLNPVNLANTRPMRVQQIVSPTVIDVAATGAGTRYIPEAGPIRWELREVVAQGDILALEILSGYLDGVGPGWAVFDTHGSFAVEKRVQFFTKDNERRHWTDREGSDGQILNTGRFYSPSANFTAADIGKKLGTTESLVAGAVAPGKGFRLEIQKVFDSKTVSTSYLLLRGPTSKSGVGYSAKNVDASYLPISVQHIVSGVLTLLSIDAVTTASGTEITVRLATSSSGDAVSTAAAVVAAVNADPLASALVLATVDYIGNEAAAASARFELSGYLLDQDAGPLFWAILSRPELHIRARTPPRGTTIQYGNDAQVVSVGGTEALYNTCVVRFNSATLFSDDLNRVLVLKGSAYGNDVVGVPIIEIVSQNSCRIPLRLSPPNPQENLTWEIHDPTDAPDHVGVEIFPQPLLPFLAENHAVELDEYASELRQRAQVFSQDRWTNQKGHPDSYRIQAKLSGFIAEPRQLWALGLDESLLVPASALMIVGSSDPARSGFNGVLSAGSFARVRLTAPTAAFASTDVGEIVRVRNLATAVVKLYRIAQFVNSTTVDFEVNVVSPLPYTSLPTSPVEWSVVRLYTSNPPLLPRYDDFNPDALEYYISGPPNPPDPFDQQQPTRNPTNNPLLDFGVDRFCWEPNFTTEMLTNVTNVTSTSVTTHIVEVDIPPYPRDTSDLADIVSIIPNPDPANNSVTVPAYRFVDAGVGGVGGTLTTVSPGVRRLTVGASIFTAADVGKSVILRDWVSGNNGIFIVVAQTSMSIDYANSVGTYPDTSVGGTWTLDPYSQIDQVYQVGPGGRAPIEYFLDSYPKYKPGNTKATFIVIATIPPVVGPATIEYVCSSQSSCGYCDSNKVALDFEAGTVVEDTYPLSAFAFDRALDKLKREVVPVHVQIIPTLRVNLQASVRIGCAVQTHLLARIVVRGRGIIRLPSATVGHLSSARLFGSGTLRGPAIGSRPRAVLHASGKVTLRGSGTLGADTLPV